MFVGVNLKCATTGSSVGCANSRIDGVRNVRSAVKAVYRRTMHDIPIVCTLSPEAVATRRAELLPGHQAG